MLRIAVIISLLLSLAFMAKAIVSGLQENGKQTLAVQEREAPKPHPLPPVKLQNYYPPVLKNPPDLKKGYVFNESRSLVKEELTDAETVADKGPKVKLEDVSYSGSIKTDKFLKALISYPAPKEDRTPEAGAPPAARGSASILSHKQLEVGEVFSGYKVVSIEPEKLVFEKGGKKTEKFLFDPKKERLKAPDLPKQARSVKSAPSRVTAADRLRRNRGGQATSPVRQPPQPASPTSRPGVGGSAPSQQRNPFVIPNNN